MAGKVHSTFRAVTAAFIIGSAAVVMGPVAEAEADADSRRAAATRPAGGSGGSGGSAPRWAIGDCFESIDVAAASLDLATEVACTKEHEAQVIGGGPLPAALATLSRDALIARSSAADPELEAFLDDVCGPTTVIANVYPKKQGKAIASLFDEYDVTSWIPAAAGNTTIVLPDDASYAAGATDALCVFLPDASFSGTTAGDVMRIGTRDPVETLRICYVRNPGSGTELSSCDDEHAFEALIFVQQDVTGLPESPTDWTADDWAPFDEMCAELGPVLVGADRKDITYRANSQPDVDAVENSRFVYCEALPAAEGKAFAGGTTVQGAGKKKLKLVDA